MKKEGRKDSSELDTMREEYDFKTMRVYRRGRGRRQLPAEVLHVTIDDDVRRAFPDAEAVNEALRVLMRAGQQTVSDHETLNQRSRS